LNRDPVLAIVPHPSQLNMRGSRYGPELMRSSDTDRGAV
jgi:hypothetical protein